MTDRGGREENQDHFFPAVDEGDIRPVFVVADGLGGHGLGRTAARLASELMGRRLSRLDSCTPDAFKEVVAETHRAIVNYEKDERSDQDMKTTCVFLALREGRAYWGSVGDSRLYMFRDGRVLRRTKDHSVVQLLVDTGEIAEAEAKHHPDRNKVYQVLGGSEEPRPFLQVEGEEYREGDAFLLCSDGFWEFFDEDAFGEILLREKEMPARELLERVFKRVRESAGERGPNFDNLTAQLIKVMQS
ncbi:PP2C family protein-serine/threonine phosphatase [Pseudodesulfovibrio indicus]|nr:PP2C family serine/threonine-protein phosphatase [Pseudodesulfovibrio indicus]